MTRRPGGRLEQLAMLGVFADPGTIACADCGTDVEPAMAFQAKVFVLDQVLGIERGMYDLFLDPTLATIANDWLGARGLDAAAITGLIDAARRLGLLDGAVGSLRLGAPRCTGCYLRRAEAYERAGPSRPWSGHATPRSRLDG